MVNLAEQVCREVTTCLDEHGLPTMDESRLSSLKTQIVALGNDGHSVRKLIGETISLFFNVLTTECLKRWFPSLLQFVCRSSVFVGLG